MAEIDIHNITKRFGAISVIENLSLTVHDKEFLVLLGPSGCGKSTLLNIVAGLETQTSGQILIGGHDVSRKEPKDRGLSMVFQSYALYPTMTVRNNMSFGLRVAGTPKAEIAQRVERAAAMLHLSELLERRPSQLSGGQRQRAAIGRALVRDVDVFLFDEPLSNLDAKLRTEMRGEIRRLHDRLGVTSIYVTHDQVEAMTMATSIAVMKGGVVQQHADPQTLYDRPANLFVAGFIGTSAINLLKGTVVAGDAVRIGEAVVPIGEGIADRTPILGREVIVGIRPENVMLAPGPVASDHIRVQLEYAEPLGADTLVWVRRSGQPESPPLSFRLPPRDATGLPDTFSVVFDRDHLSLFDPDSGQRL